MRKRRKSTHIPVRIEAEAEENPEPEWQFPANQYILDLPSHLIMEILSKLPIKALFNCRCVCKTLQNLIKDPYFAELHLARSPVSLLLRTIHPKRQSRILHLINLEGSNTCYREARMKFNSKTSLPSFKFCLQNSCNGLLCLSDPTNGDPFCVCNPILGEYVILPMLQDDVRCVGAGFGFSSETNRYKVIRIIQRMIGRSGFWLRLYDDNYEAEIYTLGEGAWRNIGNAPDAMGAGSTFNTFVNGALHWLVITGKGPDYIRSFHFGSEKFQGIPIPDAFGPSEKEFIDGMRLGVLGGCLSICDHTDSDYIDIWIMKKYGVRESWTKDFVITNLILERLHLDFYEPIIILESGDVLMLFNEDSLVRYCPKTKGFDYLNIFGVRSEFHAIAHIPSLVSLKDVVKGERLKFIRA